MSSAIATKVAAEILGRSDFGVKKYGVSLDRTDLSLSQWAQHLKEELMDAACYAQCVIEKAAKMEAEIEALRAEVESLKRNNRRLAD